MLTHCTYIKKVEQNNYERAFLVLLNLTFEAVYAYIFHNVGWYWPKQNILSKYENQARRN